MRRWHTHWRGSRKQMCDGTPSDCPTSALEKARAVVECAGDSAPGCVMSVYANANPGEFPWADVHGLLPSQVHGYCASALLDGFSIEELTEAGG